MRRKLIGLVLAAFSLSVMQLSTPVFGQTAPPAHYSVETTLIGKLIADPAAAEILKKLIPGVWANEMFHSMGRDQTLRGVQQYEPDLTDAKLAEIQAELNKIPAKG
jgi:hypothetical protein